MNADSPNHALQLRQYSPDSLQYSNTALTDSLTEHDDEVTTTRGVCHSMLMHSAVVTVTARGVLCLLYLKSEPEIVGSLLHRLQ